MELHELPSVVRTSADLASFVSQLRLDLSQNPDEWENPTLERFLDSLAAWLEDIDLRTFYNMPDLAAEHVEWRFVADMLYAARIYE